MSIKVNNNLPKINSEIVNLFMSNLCDRLIGLLYQKTAKRDYGIRTAKLVYHYTSIPTLYKIIESKSLHATNALYLNDKSEYRMGKYLYNFELETRLKKRKDSQLVKNILEKILLDIDKTDVSEYYVVCFSAEEDLLSQWKAYGDAGYGVSIGFTLNHLRPAFQHKVQGSWMGYDVVKKMKRINFISNEFFKEYSRLVRQYSFDSYDQVINLGQELYLKKLMPIFISSYKDNSFEAEREYRIALKKSDLDLEIEFMMSKNNCIVPYTRLVERNFYLKNELNLPPENEQPFIDTPNLLNKLPIERITLGPLIDVEYVTPGLRMFLDHHGYNNVKISTSHIPLR